MIAGQTFVPLEHLGDVGQTTESPTHSLISPSAARGGVSRCVFFSETFFTPHSSAATNLRSSTLMLRLTLESLSPSAYSSSGEEGAYLYSLNPDGLRIESIPFSRFRGEASRGAEGLLGEIAATSGGFAFDAESLSPQTEFFASLSAREGLWDKFPLRRSSFSSSLKLAMNRHFCRVSSHFFCQNS